MSPLLGVASGILEVRDMHLSKNTLLLQCKVKKENGCVKYEAIDRTKPGIHSKFFEAIRPEVSIMVDSYFYGMTLCDLTFCWLEDSLNSEGWENWAIKHDIDPKEIDAIPYSKQREMGV